MHATEVWGALYFRWHAFPWNDVVRTTAVISTGLNYASRIEERERRRDAWGHGGAHLLHYLAPELTFALPERQDWELVFRYHHRSGGGAIFGDTLLFNGVTGARISRRPACGIASDVAVSCRPRRLLLQHTLVGRDDIHQFVGDGLLPFVTETALQFVDIVRDVALGRLHGREAGRMLGGK